MIVQVEVDVATCRPPRADATAYVTVEADTVLAGSLLAAQIVCCHPAVVMPVATRVVHIEENRMPDLTPAAEPEGDLVSVFDDDGATYTIRAVPGAGGASYRLYRDGEHLGQVKTVGPATPAGLAAGARAALAVWREQDGPHGDR